MVISTASPLTPSCRHMHGTASQGRQPNSERAACNATNHSQPALGSPQMGDVSMMQSSSPSSSVIGSSAGSSMNSTSPWRFALR